MLFTLQLFGGFPAIPLLLTCSSVPLCWGSSLCMISGLLDHLLRFLYYGLESSPRARGMCLGLWWGGIFYISNEGSWLLVPFCPGLLCPYWRSAGWICPSLQERKASVDHSQFACFFSVCVVRFDARWWGACVFSPGTCSWGTGPRVAWQWPSSSSLRLFPVLQPAWSGVTPAGFGLLALGCYIRSPPSTANRILCI